MSGTMGAHLRHDQIAIAAHAAGDRTSRDQDRVAAVVAACAACATLLRDLRALAWALPTLPRPNRGRDFRLTSAEAARLSRFAWSIRLRGIIRPVAAGMSAAGLGAILVTAVPSLMPAAGPVDLRESTPITAPSDGANPGTMIAAPPPAASNTILDLGEAPAILLGGGLGLYLLQWGTERAGRPSRRR